LTALEREGGEREEERKLRALDFFVVLSQFFFFLLSGILAAFRSSYRRDARVSFFCALSYTIKGG